MSRRLLFLLLSCPGVLGGCFIVPDATGHVTVPDDVTSLETDAFKGCDALVSITLPDSLTSLGEGAFHECSSLVSMTLPEGLTSIAGYSFFSCTSLACITLPGGLTRIGYYAFHGCVALLSITLPNSLTWIGHQAFGGCSSLALVDVPTGCYVLPSSFEGTAGGFAYGTGSLLLPCPLLPMSLPPSPLLPMSPPPPLLPPISPPSAPPPPPAPLTPSLPPPTPRAPLPSQPPPRVPGYDDERQMHRNPSTVLVALMLAVGSPLLLCTVLAALVAIRAAHRLRAQTSIQRFSASALWSALGRSSTTSTSSLDVTVVSALAQPGGSDGDGSAPISISTSQVLVAEATQHPSTLVASATIIPAAAALPLVARAVVVDENVGRPTAALGVQLEAFGASSSSSKHGGEMDGGKMGRKLDLDVKPDGKEGKDAAASGWPEGR